MMAPISASSSASRADPAPKDLPDVDLEQGEADKAHLRNTSVHSFAWKGVTVTVKDRKTKQPKTLVDNAEGIVQAGEILAVMGPSGSGKTTLLNMLACRPTTTTPTTTFSSSTCTTTGTLLLNGAPASQPALRSVTRFVEQDDALTGALTVRETLDFASRLATTMATTTSFSSSFSSSPRSSRASASARANARDNRSKDNRAARVAQLVDAFGLRERADTLVGTGLRKGLSGGQRRRLGVAGQLVGGGARVLVLDEPTSGLDSAAGWEVVKVLRGVARREGLIVIASIHQPSTATFNLFDKLLLMSHGKTHYFGPTAEVAAHYEALGCPMPVHVNPAEFLLDMVNTDFAAHRESAVRRLDEMQLAWARSPAAKELAATIAAAEEKGVTTGAAGAGLEMDGSEQKPSLPSLVLTLLHRGFVKSYRDIVVYGIRLAMYSALAIMMGTVWLRLDAAQESIIPFINAIFYGSAFMSFMACAYCPAYLEDYMQFIKEKRNGLYGATAMIVANFLIGVPYLFIFSLVFSAISYWLSNFQPTAQAFFTWVLWVFLDLLAAESLVVLLTSVFPSFVVSLALVAFANGLWMSVDGFMVPPTLLNVFYRYVFHYWDYQKYVFENMMVNEFSERVYTCARTAGGCQCMWQTDLADQCLIRGQGVLDQYGYRPGHMGKDVGIMLAIIFGYRLAAWLVLKLKK